MRTQGSWPIRDRHVYEFVGVPKISLFVGRKISDGEPIGGYRGSWTRVNAADSVVLLLSYIVGTCRDLGHTRLVDVRRDSIVSEFGYRFRHGD